MVKQNGEVMYEIYRMMSVTHERQILHDFHISKKIVYQLNFITTVSDSIDDANFALRSCTRLIQYISPDNFQTLCTIAVDTAREYHSQKQYAKAFEVMDTVLKKCHDLMTPELVNVLLEAALLNEKYVYCLDIFLEFCNIEVGLINLHWTTVHYFKPFFTGGSDC